jgi:hypothetical protein
MRGFVGILVVLLVALVSGAIGFQAGVAANIGTTAGATVPAYALWWGFPHVGGFLFGFLFLFLFIGLIAFAFGGRRRGPWGRGYRDWYGAWGDPMDPSDPRRQWIADAHRRLHQQDQQPGTPGAPPSAVGSPSRGRDGIPPTPPAAS